MQPALKCVRPSRPFCFRSKGLLKRRASSFVVKQPPRGAPREVPTPLVFCSAGAWEPEARQGLAIYTSMFVEKGFTCIESDFVLPPKTLDSQELMDHFAGELKSSIRSSGIPFPPVIFARGFASLIAQTYVSSNPAHGLFLISPPINNASVPRYVLPSELPEFDFELKFPLAVMAQPTHLNLLKANSRLGQSDYVDLLEANDLETPEATQKMMQWVDELGI
ncbi:hypothetical protein BV22DRAFT_1018635 [Leucogyrophana mollusca]|uniref:Uncharacterized protein n=1 Tax=Leucogyrophana mollusca TaxID=85980 RepID=A0ACB8B8P1_9AGAM|nr:hypothetical protein BV22DRAFT_1018635 [Leucogyrophana mollusca]